ncbi:hypothetical protein YW90_002738 [Salmonella enterica subsp. enterica]|nr:hypothetical protein [Salmonella enterica subsp. enterica]
MNLKQLTGAVRRLLNPATGEEDTLRKEVLDEAQARPRHAGVRSASPGTRGSGYRPYRWAKSPIASARRKTVLRMSPLKCLRRASACSRLRRITRSRKS